MQMVSFKKHY